MIEQEDLRRKIAFRCSPLLDMALSLLVLHNPERFSQPGPWAVRVAGRLPEGVLDRLREHGERVDLFALALELSRNPLPVPVALRQATAQHPDLGAALDAYWEALAPEVAAQAGLLADSIQLEAARLAEMDPLAFICRFSDRISAAGDGEAIILHWGGGMRVPLRDLEQILFVPSAFTPRRVMFYRLGPVQIFFYAPRQEEPDGGAAVPERLLLAGAALADATRLQLLRLIARARLPAQEMAQRLGLNESTVSRHLRLLVEAGLIARVRQEGKCVLYGLQAGRIDQWAADLRAYLGRD